MTRSVLKVSLHTVQSPAGPMPYRVVLARNVGDATVTAYRGIVGSASGSAQRWANGWVAEHGQPLTRAEAEAYFGFDDLLTTLIKHKVQYIGAPKP